VRIGPNDLSVTDPDAAGVISGLHSKCVKADWYSNDAPLTSMHTTRDRAQHDRRRKIWGPAFTAAAIRGYQARVERYNDLLVEGLREGRFEGADADADAKKKGRESGEVNISEVFNWYSFDVMGDLAFGRSFGCLEGAHTHWAIRLLSEGMKPAGLAMPSWFFRVLVAIPGATKDYWRFIDFCCEMLRRRMEEQGEKSGEKDIAHYLIENFNGMSEKDRKEALPMLQGDSRLIIVAGSDTTAATLAYMFYWLAKDPVLVGKLREEVARCRNEKGGFNYAEAELLNGCIHEALRLNPPVPSGVFRKTPEEGVWVGKTFVPGNTTIQMPWYVMGRGEFCSCSSVLVWSADGCCERRRGPL
jgi:cytochrome P450